MQAISRRSDNQGRSFTMNTQTMDGAAANKARQRSLVDTLQNLGEIDRAGEFIHDDIVDHAAVPGMPAGIEGVKAVFRAIREAFPDHDAKIIHQITEGDLVASYKTFTGTHRGNFFGTPPTGKRATIEVMDFVRYRGGKVAEHWGIVDIAGLMRQLGAVQ
jgi:predicted ester cyclase